MFNKIIKKTHVTIIHSNCLSIYEAIPDSMKFNLVIADPPFNLNTKKNEWDEKIDFSLILNSMTSVGSEGCVYILFSHSSKSSIWSRMIKKKYLNSSPVVVYWFKGISNCKMSRAPFCKFFQFNELIFSKKNIDNCVEPILIFKKNGVIKRNFNNSVNQNKILTECGVK